MADAGFVAPLSLQAFVPADGKRRYACILTDDQFEGRANPTVGRPVPPQRTLALPETLRDVSFTSTGKLQHPHELLQECLQVTDELSQFHPHDTQTHISRAAAFYYLDRAKEA